MSTEGPRALVAFVLALGVSAVVFVGAVFGPPPVQAACFALLGAGILVGRNAFGDAARASTEALFSPGSGEAPAWAMRWFATVVGAVAVVGGVVALVAELAAST